MKDFDEFRSWIEIDKRFLKGCKKLLFDKEFRISFLLFLRSEI